MKTKDKRAMIKQVLQEVEEEISRQQASTLDINQVIPKEEPVKKVFILKKKKEYS
jgi:hypothetical protein